jgi:hypothetical protein
MLDWVCSVTGARAARRIERVQSLWSGYGEIVRVALDEGPAATVIVKEVRPPANAVAGAAERRSHERKLRSYQVEAAFYRAYAATSQARVPRCYAAEEVPSGFRFVLEDLDAAGFRARRHRVGHDELDACLRWLATFHATFMGRVPNDLWPVGTYWHLGTRPDELDAMGDGLLSRAAPAIDRALSSAEHLTLVHGDCKPANFCFGQGEVAAVDFQYVGGGCGMKDVVYLLSSLDDARVPSAIDRYFVHLRRASSARSSSSAQDALEAEWRALTPLAWADFERFLAGWSPGHRMTGQGHAMCQATFEALDGAFQGSVRGL